MNTSLCCYRAGPAFFPTPLLQGRFADIYIYSTANRRGYVDISTTLLRAGSADISTLLLKCRYEYISMLLQGRACIHSYPTSTRRVCRHIHILHGQQARVCTCTCTCRHLYYTATGRVCIHLYSTAKVQSADISTPLLEVRYAYIFMLLQGRVCVQTYTTATEQGMQTSLLHRNRKGSKDISTPQL
jgi:hypothetical protein